MAKKGFKKYRDLWNGSLIRLTEFFIDMAVIVLSLIVIAELVHFISNNSLISIRNLFEIYANSLPFLGLYLFIVMIFFLIYRPTLTHEKYGRSILSVFLSLVFTNFSLMVLSFLAKDDFLFGSPIEVFYIMIFQLIFFIIYKYIAYRMLARFNRRGVMIVGPKEEVDVLAKAFLREKESNKIVKYLVYENETKRTPKEIYHYIDEIEDVYITAGLKESNKNAIINYVLLNTYKEVYIVPKTYEINLLKSSQEQVDDTLVLRTKSMHLSFEQRFFKRAFDIFVSSIGIIVAAIPMLFITLAIKLEDGGPVLYKQERIKRNNKVFKVLKFRSMKPHKEGEAGSIASVNDNRITKVGKVIRALRVDELPQLFNIFKGEMSLVGPRPLMLSVIDAAMSKEPEFKYRSNVKPGLTGWAQIHSRYDTNDNEKLRYDLYYIRNYSFWLDIKIIFLTIKTLFIREQSVGRGDETCFEDVVKQQHINLVEVKPNILHLEKN
jgi:exopolysaccharide biosynthesis polyprenyl glycosylphosphotransferase